MKNYKWDEFYRPLDIDQYLYNLSRHRFLFTRLFELKPRFVLEAGTGSGGLSIFLSTQGLSVVSIDNNKEVLKMARKNCLRFKGKADFLMVDVLRSLPFKDIFDVAFSQGVAEHFSDEENKIFIENQLKVSKTVIISVPNYSYWRPMGEERQMSIADWSAIIKDFNVKRIRNYGREFPGRAYIKHKLLRLRVLDIFQPHHIFIEIGRW